MSLQNPGQDFLHRSEKIEIFSFEENGCFMSQRSQWVNESWANETHCQYSNNLGLGLAFILESKNQNQSNYSDQSQREQTAPWTNHNS